MIRRAALLLLAAAPAAAQPEAPLRTRIETRLGDARAILRPSGAAPRGGGDPLEFSRRRSGAASGVLSLVAEWLVEAGPAYAAVLRDVTRAREAADYMDEDGAIAAITAAQRALMRVPR